MISAHTNTKKPKSVNLCSAQLISAHLRHAHGQKTNTKTGPRNQANTIAASGERNRSLDRLCSFCDRAGHTIHECINFRSETPTERREFIRMKGLCLGCLKSGHIVKECKRRSICEKCGYKHPTCLHGDYEALNPASPEPPKEEPATVLCASQLEGEDLGCSMTVPVYISSKDDPSNEVLAYALLDTQSDTTFITNEVCEKLRVQAIPTRLKISTMTTSSVVDYAKFKNLQVRGMHSNTSVPLPTTYSRSHIPIKRSHIPTSDVAKRWPHLQELAQEIPPLQDCKVGLLIGYDCPQALAPVKVKLGKSKEPFGVKTNLGWTIVGFTGTQENEEEEHFSHKVICMPIPGELKLGDRQEVAFIHKTRTRETPSPAVICPSQVIKTLEADFQDRQQDKNISQEDLKFLNVMESNIHQNREGFYEMPLPFRDRRPDMPENLPMAKKRLEQLRRKLKSNPSFAAD